MTGRLERCVVRVLLAAYVLTGIGAAAVHNHAAAAGGPVAVTTHACGDREIHIPLEELAGCAFCLAGLSRCAILPPEAPVRWADRTQLLSPASGASIPCPVHLFSSGKRGPPRS